VVLATNFNPSVLNEYWLVTKGIVSEGAINAEERVFLPQMVKVPTEEFKIFVVPDRLQFTIAEPAAGSAKMVKEKLGAVIELLPHTPYRAVGFNFNWVAATQDIGGFQATTKSMFVKEDSPLSSHFTESDARFGAYLSKDALGFRMRLDIKPIRGENPDGGLFEGLLYSFNFNKDLDAQTAVPDIIEALAHWEEAREISEKVFQDGTRWLGVDDDN